MAPHRARRQPGRAQSLLPELEEPREVHLYHRTSPYNTGNEQWAYNDNVNDPRLLAWLGRTVGKEAEDLTRHDKWLWHDVPPVALAPQAVERRRGHLHFH
ncbi:MAG: hypothetical protein WKG07_44895 [Hymenobacter sp.]